jgi:hypothetical protein
VLIGIAEGISTALAVVRTLFTSIAHLNDRIY